MREQLTQDQLVGWAVRSARNYRGLNIGELAEELGLHRNTLSDIESGERTAKKYELRAIAATLKWPEEWLLAPLVPTEVADESDAGGVTQPFQQEAFDLQLQAA